MYSWLFTKRQEWYLLWRKFQRQCWSKIWWLINLLSKSEFKHHSIIPILSPSTQSLTIMKMFIFSWNIYMEDLFTMNWRRKENIRRDKQLIEFKLFAKLLKLFIWVELLIEISSHKILWCAKYFSWYLGSM